MYEVADERDGIILDHQSEEGNLGEVFRLCEASPKKPEPDKPLLYDEIKTLDITLLQVAGIQEILFCFLYLN